MNNITNVYIDSTSSRAIVMRDGVVVSSLTNNNESPWRFKPARGFKLTNLA